MANSSIYEKIVIKGQDQSAKILQEGRKKAHEYHDEELVNAENQIDTLRKKHHEKNQDKMKTKLTEIEQKAKQTSLGKKKLLIDNVFLLAKDKLVKLDDAQLSSFVMKKIEDEVLHGGEEIMVSKNDYERYLKIFSSGVKKNGKYVLDKIKKHELLLSDKPALISGGFIIVGKDFDLNYSFESILDNLKEKHEPVVANIMFGGN